MLLLYITYIDFGSFQSGSSVRPQMMYEAFRSLGWEVKLLQTQQNKRAERRAAVQEVSRWLDEGNRPDFCYVESPSGPIFNLCDKILLRKIHKLGIKIGYFYRDAAFRFDEVFIKGQKTPKQHAIAALSELDVKFLERTADIVYLPTKTMMKYFQFPCMMALPPACTGSIETKAGHDACGRRCIYVGGVSKRYGTDILLGAFALLNDKEEDEYTLTLVCRESEAGYIPQQYRNKPWLHIVHASGKESLAPFYKAADLALYPIEKNAYNDFALSVKLLEYLEFGLPVVAVDCTETKRFIEQFGTGLVCKSDAADFAEKVRELLSDPQLYALCALNVQKAAESGNLWTDRAKQIARDLTKKS